MHDTHRAPSERPSGPPRGVVDRMQRRTSLSRRWRLIRQMLIYLAVTLAMLAAAIANRDTQAVRNAEQRAQRIAAAMQDEFTQMNMPPLHLPALEPSSGVAPSNYYFNFAYPRAQRLGGAVGVTCAREPLHLFLRPNGRYVVLFDGSRYTVEWFEQERFAELAPQWGMGAPD